MEDNEQTLVKPEIVVTEDGGVSSVTNNESAPPADLHPTSLSSKLEVVDQYVPPLLPAIPPLAPSSLSSDQESVILETMALNFLFTQVSSTKQQALRIMGLPDSSKDNSTENVQSPVPELPTEKTEPMTDVVETSTDLPLLPVGSSSTSAPASAPLGVDITNPNSLHYLQNLEPEYSISFINPDNRLIDIQSFHERISLGELTQMPSRYSIEFSTLIKLLLFLPVPTRLEAVRMLLPIFFGFFIDMIENSFVTEAHNFSRQFSQVLSMNAQQLHALASVTTTSAISSDHFLRSWFQRRTSVALSAQVWRLFQGLLVDNRLQLILKTIMERIVVISDPLFEDRVKLTEHLLSEANFPSIAGADNKHSTASMVYSMILEENLSSTLGISAKTLSSNQEELEKSRNTQKDGSNVVDFSSTPSLAESFQRLGGMVPPPAFSALTILNRASQHSLDLLSSHRSLAISTDNHANTSINPSHPSWGVLKSQADMVQEAVEFQHQLAKISHLERQIHLANKAKKNQMEAEANRLAEAAATGGASSANAGTGSSTQSGRARGTKRRGESSSTTTSATTAPKALPLEPPTDSTIEAHLKILIANLTEEIDLSLDLPDPNADSMSISITNPLDPSSISTSTSQLGLGSSSGLKKDPMSLSLPVKTAEDSLERLADLRLAMVVNPDKKPSAMMCTLLNARDGCASLTLSPHLAMAAAGLTDGSIRLWEFGTTKNNMTSEDNEALLSKAFQSASSHVKAANQASKVAINSSALAASIAPASDRPTKTDTGVGAKPSSVPGQPTHSTLPGSTTTSTSTSTTTSSSTSTSTSTSSNQKMQLNMPKSFMDSGKAGSSQVSSTGESYVRSRPTDVVVLPPPSIEDPWPSVVSESKLVATAIVSSNSDKFQKSEKEKGDRVDLQTGREIQTLSTGDIVGQLRDALSAPVLRRLQGHSGTVTSLAFSPDNRYLLSGCEDGTIRLWLMSTKACLLSIPAHAGPVWCASFLSHYYYITGGIDGMAYLWSTDKATPWRAFRGHTGGILCIAVHPNMNYIATGGVDGTVRVWHVATATLSRIFVFPLLTKVRTIAFSPCGTKIAVGTEDSTLTLFSLQTSKPIWSVSGTLAFPLSSLPPIAQSCLNPSALANYDAGTTGIRPSCSMGTAHTGTITSLHFSNDGQLLASASLDNTIKLWSVKPLSSRANPNVENQDSKPNDTSVGLTYEDAMNTLTDHLSSTYYTKNTQVWQTQFSSRNVLFATGVFKNTA